MNTWECLRRGGLSNRIGTRDIGTGTCAGIYVGTGTRDIGTGTCAGIMCSQLKLGV